MKKNILKFTLSLLTVFGSLSVFAQIASPPSVVGDLTVCVGGSTQLTANDPTNTPGTTFNWYSKDILGNYTLLATQDTIVFGPLAISGDYAVETLDTVNVVTSAKTDFTITVDLLNSNADVITATPTDAVVCNGASTDFTAVPTLGSTVFRWYDAATGGNLLFEGNPYNPGALTVAPTLYVSGIDNNGCESPRYLAVPPVVLPALSLPIATADPLIICSGDTTKLYTTNKAPDDQVNWYENLVGGSPVFTGDTFLLDSVNTGNVNLPVTYYAEFEDTDGCLSLRTPVIVTVLPAVDLPLVDDPIQTICTGESATFTASSLLGGVTFKWYDAFTGGNLLHTGATFNTGTINNAGAADLTRNYYVSVEDGNGCESIRAVATVIITPAVDVPLITPALETICHGDSATFTASSLLGGTTFRWYDAASGGNLLHTGAEFNTGPLTNNGPSNVAQNFFVEVEDANGCVSPRNVATAIILPALALPLVTPAAAVICNGDSVEFTASSIPELPNYYWYDIVDSDTPIATGKTFNTGPLTNPSSLDVFETFFLEGEDENGCRTARVPFTVTIRPALDLPIVDPITTIVCSGDSASFSASSLLGSGVAFYWFDSQFGGTQLGMGADFKTGPITNTSGANVAQTFWVELEDANGCRSLRSSGTVVVRPALDVPVANPPVATICSGDSAVFTGTSLLGTNATYRWYNQLVGGTEIFEGDTFSTGPISNGGNATASATFFLELEDTAGCRSLRSPATVVVVPAVDVPLVDNPVQVVCDGEEAIFVASSLLGATNFNWYDALLGGNLLFQGDTFSTGPLTNPSGVDIARNYFVEAVDSNGCTSIRIPVTAVIRPNLDIPAVLPPAQIVCNGERATFVATSVGNLIGQPVVFKWYDALIGGNEVFEGDTFVTPPFINNTGTDFIQNYFVEAVDTNGCKSIRFPVTLTIRPALDLPLVDPLLQIVCNGDSAEFVASSLLGSASSFHWFDALIGGIEIFEGDTFNTGAINNAGTTDLTRSYFVELEDTLGCRSLRVPVTVIIRPAIDVPVVNPPLSIICQGESVQLVASSLFDAEYRWYDSLIGGNLIFQGDTFNSDPIFNTNPTNLDTLFYVEAVDSLGCVSPIRTFGTVIIRPALNAPVVNPIVDTICSGGEVVFAASSLLPGASNYFWYTDSIGGTPIFVGDTFRTVVNNSSTADVARRFYVELEDTTGCRSIRAVAQAIITPGLVGPVVDPAVQRICSGNRATIVATSALSTDADFFWYTGINETTPVFQGDTFVTEVLFNNTNSDASRTYYVEQRDTSGLGCKSQRTPATVIITRSPNSPIIENPVVSICNGQSATFVANGPDGVTGVVLWYESQTSDSVIAFGDTLVTEELSNNGNATASYNFFAEFRDSSGCVSERSQATVFVQPFLDAPTANPANQVVCSGGDAVVGGSSVNPSTETFNWFDDASSQTPIFTGDTLVLTNLINNSSNPDVRTYYIQSVDSAGCTSAKTAFTITVQGAGDAPTVTPDDPTICSESDVTLSADSDFGPEGTYYWYDNATDQNPIFVGQDYTTPVSYNFDGSLVQENYFVQVEDTNGCFSKLEEVIVTTSTNGDDVIGALESTPVCEGNAAVITGISDKGFTTFKWYKNQTDIVPFFEGTTLTTTPLFSDTVFYLSSFDGDCPSIRQRVAVPVLEIKTLSAPVVNCLGAGNPTSVTFTWNVVANAESYQVSTNNGVSWVAANGSDGLSHTIQRSNEEQTSASIIVRARQTPTPCSEEFGPRSVQMACFFGKFVKDENPNNAFSPNGDGVNDFWYIQDGIEDFKDNKVVVFNRWGQEIFETTGYDNDKNVFTGIGKNGKQLEDGAYFYIVTIPSENIKKTGYVMIIR
ncbi:gliding motility-associated C-terminal domain-containing protein [Luteibaculum oceani]|nr:gliding motility-associated C-terminal domain-containing protein [Luteibaculum oceani]